MNRKERRKNKKPGEKLQKEAVLQIKPEALEQMIKASVEQRLDAERKFMVEKARAEAKAVIRQDTMDADERYSLDIDAMVLWTLHARFGWGKKRLEEFYAAFMDEHTRMRERYEMEDTYPERYKLREIGVDVEELNQRFKDACENNEKGTPDSEEPGHKN